MSSGFSGSFICEVGISIKPSLTGFSMGVGSPTSSPTSSCFQTNVFLSPIKIRLKLSSNLYFYNPNFFFNTRASRTLYSPSPTKTPSIRRKIPPRKFPRKRHPLFPKEENTSPLSFPIHTKNPNAICQEIQRFARESEMKEALTLLDYAVQQGCPINLTTFSCLMAACIRSKSLQDARKIHFHICSIGLENSEFLRTRLVKMFTSCSAMEDARKIFDGLPGKSSVYPWNDLLRGTIVSGMGNCHTAFSIFSQMRSIGVELDIFTFSCLLKSVAGAAGFTQALQIHALLMKNGFASNAIVGTTLIDAYFKCARINLAHRVFDEIPIPNRDIVIWGAMIAGFAHNRLGNEALDYLRQMRKYDISPNSILLTTILPVIGDLSYLKLGREAHAYVIKTKSYSLQSFIQSALIDMYCKCGDLNLGRRVFFYATDQKNVVSWTALVSGYASNGKYLQALRSLLWMQRKGCKPDIVTISTVLPVCTELRALRQGKEIHGYVLRNNFVPHVTILTSLIVMYSKCGLLEQSFRLFDRMHIGSKNVICSTAMIDSCAENGRPDDALTVFRAIGRRLDCIAIARILRVCAELKGLMLGKEIHGQILRKNFNQIQNPFVYAELIKLYAACSAIDNAMSVFVEMRVKCVVTWTAIIEAFGYNETNYEGGIILFHKMCLRGVVPNYFTLDAVLSICGRAGFVDEACKIFDSSTQYYGLVPSAKHYSLVIDLLSHAGRFEEARRYVRMRSKSFVS